MKLTRQHHVIFALLFVLFFFSRLYFIHSYPIFNDESINIHYGKLMVSSSRERFLSLSVGKQPLMYWLQGVASQYGNPLVSARLVSLLLSIFSLLIIMHIGRVRYGIRSSIWSGILLSSTVPFILFDSLALQESAVVAAMTSVLLYIHISEKIFRLKHIIIVSMVIGITAWGKGTALLFLLSLTLVLFNRYRRKKINSKQYIGSTLILIVIPFVSQYILSVRPEYTNMQRYQYDFVLRISEMLMLPHQLWLSNIGNTFLSLFVLPLPIILLGSMYSIYAFRKDSFVQSLGIYMLCSLCILTGVGRVIHLRYVYFLLYPLVILAGYAFTRLRTVFQVLTALTVISSATFFVFKPEQYLLYFPSIGSIARDQEQYITGYTSGYGIAELLTYLNSLAEDEKGQIVLRNDPGNPEDALFVYEKRLHGYEIGYIRYDGYTLLYPNPQKRMYLVTRSGKYDGLDRQIELIARFSKPGAKNFVELYQLYPVDI